MKLGKMLLIVLVLGFLVIPQLSYAGTSAVNLRGDAAGTVEGQDAATKAVQEAAAQETKKPPLASNQTVVTSADELLWTVTDFAKGSGTTLVIFSQDYNPKFVADDLTITLVMNGNVVNGMPAESFSEGLRNPDRKNQLLEDVRSARSVIVLANETGELREASKGTSAEDFLDFKKTLTVSIGKTRLASGETIAQAFPAIFTEAMTGVLTLPATQFVDVSNADANVERLAKFVASGADGQYVVVMGSTQDQLNAVVARLEKAGLSIKDYENKIIFFATVGNQTIVNIEALFMDKQGDFSLCKADNLSPETRKAIQGAV